ncbi:MAG: hypothetical protein ACJ8FT_09640 [Sphingomonas sp.]
MVRRRIVILGELLILLVREPRLLAIQATAQLLLGDCLLLGLQVAIALDLLTALQLLTALELLTALDLLTLGHPSGAVALLRNCAGVTMAASTTAKCNSLAAMTVALSAAIAGVCLCGVAVTSATPAAGKYRRLLPPGREAAAVAVATAPASEHRREASAPTVAASAATAHEDLSRGASASAVAVAAAAAPAAHKDLSWGAAAAAVAVAMVTATATAAAAASISGSTAAAIAATAAVRIATATAAAWLCCSRARDRQSGDARGENQPGHCKISSRTEENGPFDTPFHRLNGWNLRPSASG